MVSRAIDPLKIQQGDDVLTMYQRGTHTGQYYFCKICGIYTFHNRRTDPSVHGINISCFDDLDLVAFYDLLMADSLSLSLVHQ